jgi:hypothetical protein
MPITKAFIIHGSMGSPNSNWFPWLKTELEKLHLNVFAPQFPIGERQNLSNWMSEFKRWENAADEETIMIGHSMGPAFIFNFLEKSGKKIAAAFLVAPFVGELGNSDIYPPTKTFAGRDFNWDKIKRGCREFFIYSSDNDPYVPLEKGEFLSKKLNARFKIIHNGGHINEKFGYTKFGPILDDIKTFIAKQ